jgi:CheY-like chemotaxis protein
MSQPRRPGRLPPGNERRTRLMAQRILVVNDTKEILDLFEDLLTGEGFEVVLYSYGINELPEIKERRPDLIILDYVTTNEKPGWQLLQKLRMDQETVDIPIIVCSTAIRRLKELEGWLAEKKVGVVLKPFTLDDLMTAVNHALRDVESNRRPA